MIETAIADARKVAALLEPAFAVIAVAEAATGIGGPAAELAIKVIQAALQSFAGVVDGTVTHDQALASLSDMKAKLASNDAAADAELAARFPG